jgi:hypothetical protein
LAVSKHSILLAVWDLAKGGNLQLVGEHNDYRGEKVI